MLARAAIYLDLNAGAPLSLAARRALLPLLGDASAMVSEGDPSRSLPILFPGNPSSRHSYGREAKRFLTNARVQVARSLGVGIIASDILFTSSGTEANQTAIRSILEPLLDQGKKPHWILSRGEHDATLQMTRWFESRGGVLDWVDLDLNGAPSVSQLSERLRPDTALVSLIWVNNETGVITDLSAVLPVLEDSSALLHLDGAQAWGKVPLDVSTCGASLVSFSGHKIGGPAGTGVLWRNANARARAAPLLPGKQESGWRGGTENLLGVIALGASASVLDPVHWETQVRPLRDRMEQEVRTRIPGSRIHGAASSRIANTSSLGFSGVSKDGLVMALDLAGYSVSSGSACSSGIAEPSHVLRAMGLSEGDARSAVRVSIGPQTSWDDLNGFVDALAVSVNRMRGGSS